MAGSLKIQEFNTDDNFFANGVKRETHAAMTQNLEVNRRQIKKLTYLRGSHFENHIMLKDFNLTRCE